MAIIVEAEAKRTNWVAIAGLASLFIFLLTATYYLFFSPTPLVEFFAPPELSSASRLAEIDISLENVRTVTNHPVEDLLKPHVAPPLTPQTGRLNPFLSFQ